MSAQTKFHSCFDQKIGRTHEETPKSIPGPQEAIEKTYLKLIDFGLSKRFSPGDFAKTKVREGGRGRRTVQLVLWTEKPNCRLWNEGRQAGRQAGRKQGRKEGRKEGAFGVAVSPSPQAGTPYYVAPEAGGLRRIVPFAGVGRRRKGCCARSPRSVGFGGV